MPDPVTLIFPQSPPRLGSLMPTFPGRPPAITWETDAGWHRLRLDFGDGRTAAIWDFDPMRRRPPSTRFATWPRDLVPATASLLVVECSDQAMVRLVVRELARSHDFFVDTRHGPIFACQAFLAVTERYPDWDWTDPLVYWDQREQWEDWEETDQLRIITRWTPPPE